MSSIGCWDMGESLLGSFVTTFNRPDALAGTLEAIRRQTRPPDLLAVVDNGTGSETEDVVKSFGDVEYIKPAENLGSAGGTALGMQLMHAEGCTWIQSIDDDDPPTTDDTIARLLALADRQHSTTLGAVGAFGTWWDWQRGQIARIPDERLRGDIQVSTLSGNSQLIVHRQVLDVVGPPDRQLFFGFYDPLYSLQLERAGFTLWVDGDLMLTYREQAGRLGVTAKRSLVPRDPYHGIWRRYYVSRNYIHRMRTMFDRRDLARRELTRGVVRAAFSFARGPRYGIRYAQMQARGIVDGYRGRLGRRVSPVQKPNAR